ncbi:MAG: DNA polymerase III subunit delta [Lactobacillaceae bacterium]|jgi:DNA polymerase-3 subunit delta|nr:DNA polymerase III subunit delta [Lactobacillaceae bacterium]
MELTFQQLKTDLTAKQVAPVYLIQGTDQYLLRQVRQAFTDLIEPDDRSMNLAPFDMREVPLGYAIDDARSIPFFGDKRVVIIDNAGFLTGETGGKIEHQVDDLIEYIEHPEPQTILVIFAPFEKLDGRKKITKLLKERVAYLPFGDITEKEIAQMVQAKLSEHGFQINPAAGQLLLRLTNLDITQIMAELDKLMLYRFETKIIDEEAVLNLVTKTLGENIFDLIDALLKNKIANAVTLYHELLTSGEEPLRLHGALIGQFRLLLQVKAATTSEQGTATALKVHPYRVKLAKQTVRNFSYKSLAKAYLGLVAMEKQLKSTQRDPELLFELFVLQYQQEKAAR